MKVSIQFPSGDISNVKLSNNEIEKFKPHNDPNKWPIWSEATAVFIKRMYKKAIKYVKTSSMACSFLT